MKLLIVMPSMIRAQTAMAAIIAIGTFGSGSPAYTVKPMMPKMVKSAEMIAAICPPQASVSPQGREGKGDEGGANEMLYPASLTKVMTALVAIKNGNLEETLVATENVKISERGATLIGLKSGDTMTLNQALHILLINSSNDVANLIAENIGGDIETFVGMMNEEAVRLGATNTNFTNPHGLSDSNHYTTVYDMYLIFNEAIKYDKFNEIIHTESYETVYYDSRGREKSVDITTTNMFLRGNYTAPNNMTIVGGKTGTTDMSGHCLMILAKDTSGNPYIGVILRASSRDLINTEMVQMLSEINK